MILMNDRDVKSLFNNDRYQCLFSSIPRIAIILLLT